jgi:hypothetical protein
MFLTKKFKEITGVKFLKLFVNAMIMNMKIQNILNIIKISKSMELNKHIFKNYENVYLNVSYVFSKFDGSKKIKL